MKVEFVPHVSDYLAIANELNRSDNNDVLYRYFNYLFWLVNCIVVPAYLIWIERYLIGSGLFVFDLVAYFVYAHVNSGAKFEKRAAKLYDHLVNNPMTIELTNDGIVCTHNGNSSIAVWKNISKIIETDETVYFMLGTYADFVRKDAFTSTDELLAFMNFARENIRGTI